MLHGNLFVLLFPSNSCSTSIRQQGDLFIFMIECLIWQDKNNAVCLCSETFFFFSFYQCQLNTDVAGAEFMYQSIISLRCAGNILYVYNNYFTDKCTLFFCYLGLGIQLIKQKKVRGLTFDKGPQHQW